jgi:Leucine-rich repeat (LRR) protein
LNIKSEQAKVLNDLEEVFGREIPCINGIDWNYLSGIKLDDGNIQELHLYNCELKNLPDSFGRLKNLKYLRLINTGLKTLPSSFGDLKALQALWLNNNKL